VTPYRNKASLSPARRHLLELCQLVNFGRVGPFSVLGGDPVLNSTPRLVYEIKFGGENGPRPERNADDFQLKAQFIELFQCLDQFGDGTIEAVEVKHGLPFRMIVAKDAC
jgi:hypothetical protein